MHWVYLLQSLSNPAKKYIGLAKDVEARLRIHNKGGTSFTSRHRPWKVVAVFGFPSRKQAAEFERYLKTGSGWAFAKRHFWPTK